MAIGFISQSFYNILHDAHFVRVEIFLQVHSLCWLQLNHTDINQVSVHCAHTLFSPDSLIYVYSMGVCVQRFTK